MPSSRNVVLPVLQDYQKEWRDDDHRFKVVVAGRRSGKTVTGKSCVIEGHGPVVGKDKLGRIYKYKGLLRGGRIWWVTRDNGTLDDTIWPNVRDALAPITLYKNENQHRIITMGNGELVCKSAEGKSMRGSGLDGIVGDEAAFWKDGIWQADLRPALSDRNGWGMLITTPNGGNWFYDEWQAIAARAEWEGFTAPTSINPRIPASEIEEARQTLHPLVFQQEYLAEFIVATGDVFKKEWISYFEVPEDDPDFMDAGISDGAMDLCVLHPSRGDQRVCLRGEGTYFVTADLATSLEETADWTVIGVWQLNRYGDLLLHYVERRRIEGPDLAERIGDIAAEWGCRFVAVEETGHKTIIQQLIRNGVPTRSFRPGSGEDKRTRAIPVATRMMNGKVFIRNHQEWTKGLELEMLRFTGAKDGIDDQVDMLAYAEIARNRWLSGRPLVGGR